MKLRVFGAFAAICVALTSISPAMAKSPYDKIIAKYARAYGVPVNLAR